MIYYLGILKGLRFAPNMTFLKENHVKTSTTRILSKRTGSGWAAEALGNKLTNMMSKWKKKSSLLSTNVWHYQRKKNTYKLHHLVT